MQRIVESRWWPLELCYWPDQGALPAKGKEYPGLGYKRLRDKPPRAMQRASKAEQAAEPTQPTEGKADKAKPAPQPGRWLDRGCNAALNMQRIVESRWWPLELCYWPDQGALPAKGKEYPGLGYKRLRDKPPRAMQRASKAEQAAEPTQPTEGKADKAKPAPQPGRWLDRGCNAALNMQRIVESRWWPLELCYWPDQGALPAKGKEYPGLGYKRLRDKPPRAMQRDDDDYPLEVPTRFELMQRPDKLKPSVRVRLSVHYRVHSRQMLCIGGSQIPLGWSFLSIAKVELQAGQRIEYKYVILEEQVGSNPRGIVPSSAVLAGTRWHQQTSVLCVDDQDWTKLENEDAQGLVAISYRSGSEPGRPPDVQAIQKQMAIVAWQPGPNRILHVPSEAELNDLKAGDAIERIPAQPGQKIPYENTIKCPPPSTPDPFQGTWEVLTTDAAGKPFLDRQDMWGWVPGRGLGGSSPPPGPSKNSKFGRSSL
ncbi:hypothetical protein QJQ45_004092 [Haematococcus lacustris]|nr:hypothetical protein QJQ45_004092 [Haematococcus lacustris]